MSTCIVQSRDSQTSPRRSALDSIEAVNHSASTGIKKGRTGWDHELRGLFRLNG
jgi:hypothetical protein